MLYSISRYMIFVFPFFSLIWTLPNLFDRVSQNLYARIHTSNWSVTLVFVVASILRWNANPYIFQLYVSQAAIPCVSVCSSSSHRFHCMPIKRIKAKVSDNNQECEDKSVMDMWAGRIQRISSCHQSHIGGKHWAMPRSKNHVLFSISVYPAATFWEDKRTASYDMMMN